MSNAMDANHDGLLSRAEVDRMMAGGAKSAEQVMSLIKELNEREKTTFIISTHDESIADQCEIRVEIKDGRI